MKKQYPFGNQMVPGEEIEFEVEKESFNVYILHDGTRLKFKAVIASIVRLDAYGQNGEPLYMVNASNVVAADVPETLRKRVDH